MTSRGKSITEDSDEAYNLRNLKKIRITMEPQNHSNEDPQELQEPL